MIKSIRIRQFSTEAGRILIPIGEAPGHDIWTTREVRYGETAAEQGRGKCLDYCAAPKGGPAAITRPVLSVQ